MEMNPQGSTLERAVNPVSEELLSILIFPGSCKYFWYPGTVMALQ